MVPFKAKNCKDMAQIKPQTAVFCRFILFLGSGLNGKESPVEWGDFPSNRLYVQMYVLPRPKSQQGFRASQASKPASQPARPPSQPARPPSLPEKPPSQPARPLS